MPVPNDVKDILTRQKYKLVGEHSAVKLCHWTKQAIRTKGDRCCYKEKFYGIKSHRCLQMTPAVCWCTHRCVFCWRPSEAYNETNMDNVKLDDPEFILENAILAQRDLLQGYKGISDRIDMNQLNEAFNPNQVAISLAGEATLYPNLSGLIDVCTKKDMTTFLVSNGTQPQVIEDITKPTQLYISVDAPNEKVHNKINLPQIKDAWQKITETLSLLPSIDTNTVLRLTIVKGFNDFDAQGYSRLIKMADPTYIEVKAYMFTGYSRERLTIDAMPTHEDIEAFSKEISLHSGYEIKDRKEDSRVVLLAH